MPNIPSVVHYFTVVLPKLLRLRQREAAALHANVRFTVIGRGGGIWTLRLRPPVARVVSGAGWKADLNVKITLAEMLHILSGRFNVKSAIQAGNVELQGDWSLLRQIGFLLS